VCFETIRFGRSRVFRERFGTAAARVVPAFSVLLGRVDVGARVALAGDYRDDSVRARCAKRSNESLEAVLEVLTDVDGCELFADLLHSVRWSLIGPIGVSAAGRTNCPRTADLGHLLCGD
jgi:hypothetical protein